MKKQIWPKLSKSLAWILAFSLMSASTTAFASNPSEVSPFAETKYEAEDCTFVHGDNPDWPKVEESSQASGGKHLGWINEENAGILIEDAPASTKVTIAYSAPIPEKGMGIFVNGELKGTAILPGTGGWMGPYEEVTVPLEIPQGADVEIKRTAEYEGGALDYVVLGTLSAADLKNSVKIDTVLPGDKKIKLVTVESFPENYEVSIVESSAPEIVDIQGNITTPEEDVRVELKLRIQNLEYGDDFFEYSQKIIVPANPPHPEGNKYEAEDGIISSTGTNPAYPSINEDPTASNGKFVGDIAYVTEGVTFSNVPEATKITFAYVCGYSSAQMSLYINGEFVKYIDFPGTGGWGDRPFKTIDVLANIKSGDSVKLQRDGGNSVNLDYVVFGEAGLKEYADTLQVKSIIRGQTVLDAPVLDEMAQNVEVKLIGTSDPDVISLDGKIVSGDEAKKVTLTYQITWKGESLNKEVEVTVPKKLGPKGEMRRKVDNEHPLFLYHFTGEQWEGDVVEYWKSIPDEMKPYSAIMELVSPLGKDYGGIPQEDWKQIFTDFMDKCEANNIPVVVQAFSGCEKESELISIDWFAEQMEKYPNSLLGFNTAELYNSPGWFGNAEGNHSQYVADMIYMLSEHGGYFVWTDTNVFGKDGVILDWIQENEDLINAMRLNKDNVIMCNKQSYTDQDTDSLNLGLWLSGLCGNWGMAADFWRWQLSGYSNLFGEGDRVKAAWDQCTEYPEALYGMDIIRGMGEGATVFVNEAGFYTGGNAIDGYDVENSKPIQSEANSPLPTLKNVITPLFKKITDGTFEIPTREEVLEKNKVVFYGLGAFTNPAYGQYSSLYMESGRYGTIPLIPKNVTEEELALFDNVIYEKQSKEYFDKLYPSEVNSGNTFANRTNDQWYWMNYSDNTDVQLYSDMIPQINRASSFRIESGPHTYALIREDKDFFTVHLNNYRVDKSQLSSIVPNTMQETFNWINGEYKNNTPDQELRETMISVTGLGEKPEAVFEEATKKFTYEESYDADSDVYTLKILHNGPVDFKLVSEEPDPANTDSLKALYDAYKELENKNYTEATWKAFQDALTQAEEILSRENLTVDDQQLVDTAENQLQEAIDSLKRLADKSDLKDLYDAYKDQENKGYTEATWKVFQDALAQAEEILSREDLTEDDQQLVDTAEKQLQEAIDSLIRLADKSELKNLLEKLANLDLKGYTDLSVDKFHIAWQQAIDVMNDTSLTKDDQQKVEEAVKALTEAYKALEKISSPEQKPDEPDDGETEKNPQTGNFALIPEAFIIALLAGGVLYLSSRRRREYQ